jgi:tetratricopeptide (TPR) repeat protein
MYLGTVKLGIDQSLIRAYFTTVEDFKLKLQSALVEWKHQNESKLVPSVTTADPDDVLMSLAAGYYNYRQYVPRDRYLAAIRAALVPGPGMFLLSGAPGTGKSTLAHMFVKEVRKDFDIIVFQFCGQRNVEVIAGELADKLIGKLGQNLTPMPPEQKLKTLQKWLNERRSLLVLDDVWLDPTVATNAAGPGDQKPMLHLKDLLPGPRVSVLFTSRRRTLPWLVAKQTLTVESFTPEEAEMAFRLYLDQEIVDTHRAALHEFAERVGWLPVAVTVGGDLLRQQFGPLGNAVHTLILRQLRNEIHDVADLLDRAIQAQGEPERQLLRAAAMCVAEYFWMPLAIEIAQMTAEDRWRARDNVVNAPLLRPINRELQLFQFHALLREHLRDDSVAAEQLRKSYVAALERLFEDWEQRWADCRECLEEVMQAAEFLGKMGEVERLRRLTNWGHACARRIGELNKALRIARQAETFWTGRGDCEAQDGLQASYGNQAVILQDWGRVEEAMALLKKQETICMELGNKEGLAQSYGNQALILKDSGRLQEAMALHRKQEEICLDLGDKDGLQSSYGNQALILQAQGNLEDATTLLKKQEAICFELSNKDGLQRSYRSQALILKVWGRLDEAVALLKKQELICLELGNKNGLAFCYWDLGLVAVLQRDRVGVKEKLARAFTLFEELRMPLQRDAVQAELDKYNSAD